MIVGNAAVDQNQGDVSAFNGGKHGGPEFRFKPQNQIWVPVADEARGKEGVVYRQILVKSPLGQAFAHQFGGGGSAGGYHDVHVGISFQQFVNQRQHGERFTDRCPVKPDKTSFRAFEQGTADAFVETFDVFFAALLAFLI